VGETAWLLRLSEKTVRRMLKAGNLVIIRIGRSARIDPQTIEKIICQDEEAGAVYTREWLYQCAIQIYIVAALKLKLFHKLLLI